MLLELFGTGVRTVIETYRLLGLKLWILFWFSSNTVSLKFLDMVFNIRNNDFKSKFWDAVAIVETVVYKTYNIAEFDIKESDTVIDVGAHIGGFSILAAKAAKKGKVYAFEPFDENYQQLLSNIKINQLRNVVALNEAISNKTGTAMLYYNNLCNISPSLYEKAPLKSLLLKKEIKSTRLVDFFKRLNIKRCDFLKMDCEGSEYDILLNLRQNTLKKIKKIVCEYHEPTHFKNKNLTSTPRELIYYLKSKDYLVHIRKTSKDFGIIYARRP